MDVPYVTRCLGTFPVKYASYLIALLGLAVSGTGLAAVVMYALVREVIMGVFDIKFDETAQKGIVLSVGFTSLFVFCGSFLTFLGVTTRKLPALWMGVWIIFVLSITLISLCIGFPVICYFLPKCPVRTMTTAEIFAFYVGLCIFIQTLLYFMVVIHNYANIIEELGV
ncbi:uncharacterized protein LOC142986600 [Anticarsia gemmatalis]|uniref:uncharacterized protein LOC142986600 n=1 Tax=Anticarsia gemmatalis TaxID=129554 RepID=UPI003F76FC6F